MYKTKITRSHGALLRYLPKRMLTISRKCIPLPKDLAKNPLFDKSVKNVVVFIGTCVSISITLSNRSRELATGGGVNLFSNSNSLQRYYR